MVLTLNELNKKLFAGADILRGSIHSQEYKDYIFGLLFLKRLSDEFNFKAEVIMKERIAEGFSEEDAKEIAYSDPDEHSNSFFVPKDATWEELTKKSNNIGEHINKMFEVLEHENPSIQGVLGAIDYDDKEKLSDAVLSRLVIHFTNIGDLSDNNLESIDILGRAYEYLIRYFADKGGQKGGEFYTPEEVVDLIVRLVKPDEKMKVLDPNVGSGGFLNATVHYLKNNLKDANKISLYGQERNISTWAICKMNMLMHNHLDARIEKGDSVVEWKFVENGEMMLFDRVLANPMWNQKEWSRDVLEKGDPLDRIKYGLPPKSSADWFWIQHMFASLNDEGVLGIVLDNGVLFRGGQEKVCREGFVEDDKIEAVIGLTSRLFYNTGSPATILIINKNKPEERKDKILFIDASDEFEEGKKQDFMREGNIKKIVEAFDKYENIEKFASVVDKSKIKENDYNLNISLYVDTSEEEEKIDVSEKYVELLNLRKEREESFEKMQKDLEVLGYSK